MRKRSLAALLAFSLAFTTVLPAAAADLPEGSTEAAAEMQMEQPAVAAEGTDAEVETTEEIPADEAVDSEDAAEEAPVEESAEDVLVDDELSTEEVAAEEPDAEIAAAEPQIMIEGSEIVDAPSIEAGTAEIDTDVKKTLTEVRLGAQPSYGAGSVWDNALMSIPAEIVYDGGSSTEEITKCGSVSGWVNPLDGKSYDAGLYSTQNGDTVYLTLWSGSQIVDMPIGYGSNIPTGELTLKAIVNNEPVGTADITIEEPDNVTQLTEGEDAEYNIVDGKEVWFRFTPAVDDEYSANNNTVNLTWYVQQEGLLQWVSSGISVDGCAPVAMKAGTEYLLYVSSFDGVSGSLSVIKYRDVQSITVDTKETYDASTFLQNVSAMPLQVIYEGATEPVPLKWNGSRTYQEKEAYWYLTEAQESVYLTLWSGDQQLDVPLTYDSGVRIPVGELTFKIFYKDKEGDTVHFTVADPSEYAETLTEGKEASYTINAGEEAAWFRFTAEEDEEYVIKEELGGSSINNWRVYTREGDFLVEQGMPGGSISAAAGTEYLIAIPGFSGSSASGTVSVNRKKEIEKAELTAADSYDILTFGREIQNTKAEIFYAEEDQSETVSFMVSSYMDKETGVYYYALHAVGENGNDIYVIMTRDGSIVNMPISGMDADLQSVKYTLKLIVDGQEYASKDITIQGPENVTPLTEDVPAAYNLSAGETAWYSYNAAADGDCILNLKTEKGYASCRVFVKTDGSLLEQYPYSEFNVEAGKEYLITVMGSNADMASGTICVTRKREVASVQLAATSSYDTLTAYAALKNVHAVISYEGTTQTETIDLWGEDWYETDAGGYNILSSYTENKDRARLMLLSGEGMTNMPSMMNPAAAGSYTLKLTVGGKECSQPISFVPPTETVLPESFTMADGDFCCYTIPVQAKETILAVEMTSDDEDAWLNASLYKEEGGKFVYVSSPGLWMGMQRIDLEAGQKYWMVLRNTSGCSVSGKAALTEKLPVESVTGFSLAAACSTLDALDAIYVAADNLKVNYTNGTSGTVTSWGTGWYVDAEENGWNCLEGKTENENVVQLRLKKDGANASILYSRYTLLGEGNYTISVYVDGVEQKDAGASFKVLAVDPDSVETLEEGKDYPLSLKKNESKWFKYTAKEDGEYAVYASSEDSDSSAEMYDESLKFITDDDNGADDFSLIRAMTAGETYYYKVHGCDYDAADFVVTLSKKLELKSVKPGMKLSQTSYEQEEDASPVMSMIFVYTDDSEQEVFLHDSDSFGHCLWAWMYPVDASGQPDMTKRMSVDLGAAPGNYLIIARACYYDEDEDEYVPYENIDTTMEERITITPPSHIHSYTWQVGKPATCTENGVEEYRCECGLVSDTRPIPATGHTWGEWKTVAAATTSAPEQQERECSVCHTKETQSVGSPLPAAPQTPQTEAPQAVTESPILEVPETNVKMQQGQATTAFSVKMAEGDSIVSVESSNKKILKVAKINKTKGTFKLKAKKKGGKVKLTIKLASGLEKTVTVKVQPTKVTTKKILDIPKKLSMKAKQSVTLEPTLKPITTQDKLTYTSSNKNVATVSGKGVIKAKKAGTATITVTSGKKQVKCVVTVK